MEGKIALAEQVIAERTDLDGELAFDLVASLVDPLRRAGRVEALEAIIGGLRDLRPAAYHAESHWMAFWQAENATLLRGGDLRAPLAVLAKRPERSVDEILRIGERLRYHGRVSELTALMVATVRRVEAEEEITPFGKIEFREIAFSLLLDRQLEIEPNLRADDPAFLAAMAPVSGMEPDRLERILLHAGGRSTRLWERTDFAGVSREERADNTFFLTLDFARTLHTAWGWTRARAGLGREMICRYVLDDRGSPVGKPKAGHRAPRPHSFLLPDPDSAERFAVSRLQYVGSQPHCVAAFTVALPLWLHFIRGRGLVGADDIWAAHEELRSRFELLPELLDRYVYDPVMIAELRRSLDSGGGRRTGRARSRPLPQHPG